MASNIKKGDNVLVISGKEKGKTGKVLIVNTDKNRAIVSGLNIVARSTKPKKGGEKGAIKKQEGTIDVSNLQIVCEQCNKATRVAHNLEGEKKIRVCKKCGASLDKAMKKEIKKTTVKKSKTEAAPVKKETAKKPAGTLTKTAKKPAGTSKSVTQKAPVKTTNKNTSVRKTGSK